MEHVRDSNRFDACCRIYVPLCKICDRQFGSRRMKMELFAVLQLVALFAGADHIVLGRGLMPTCISCCQFEGALTGLVGLRKGDGC